MIDPFQHELHPVTVDRNISASEMAVLLDCRSIESVNLNMVGNGVHHYAWADEQGLLREPFVYPSWMIPSANGGQGIAGYGLVFGMDLHGEMIHCQLPLEAIAHVIGFERWRARIKIDDVIPQMMRIYELGWV